MANYRRVSACGGIFFFTVVTYRRRPILDRSESRHTFREVIEEVRMRYPFSIDAWVLLPDHVHCIWTLSEGVSDFSLRWGLIKSGFSKRTKALFNVEERMNDSRLKHRESTVWQRRFWERQIRDFEEYRVYMDYIHYNPGKHGYVKRVFDWPYSTFHRYVKAGIYVQHWGGGITEVQADRFGE
ncbi:MAG: transposase [Syntrophobacteraceae bacterium]|nr:transposase [Syntrophobacteraceae bacterium]